MKQKDNAISPVHENTRPGLCDLRFLNVPLVLMLVGLVVCLLVLAGVPPVSRDALTHHLAVPKLYLQHGGIIEIPWVKFSYYPMNLDLLYLVALYIGSDILPKYIHLLFGLLTAWLIYRYLHDRIGRTWGLLGALFFLSLPVIIKLSITVYVDLGLIFFSLASLLAFLRWVEHGYAMGYLLLAALWCGLALGTKYNGLIVLCLLTLFTAFLYARHHRDQNNASIRSIGYAVIFGVVAIAVFSPWAVRNMVWKGNPVYPLYQSLFAAGKSGVKSAVAQVYQGENNPNPAAQPLTIVNKGNPAPPSGSFSPLAIRKLVFGESWWQIALLPVRIFFEGRDNDPKFFDGRLNPLLLILPLMAFVGARGEWNRWEAEKTVLLAFSVLYLLYATFSADMRIRYVGPIIPPLVILSVLGMKNSWAFIADRFPKARGWVPAIITSLVVTIFLGLNGQYLKHQFVVVKPWDYISGMLSRDAYIEQFRPEYALLIHANVHLPQDATILGLFLGNRLYYSERKMIFKETLFRKAVQESSSPEQIAKALKQKGVSHLLVYQKIFDFWKRNNFDDHQLRMVDAFFVRNQRMLIAKNGFGLYEVHGP